VLGIQVFWNVMVLLGGVSGFQCSKFVYPIVVFKDQAVWAASAFLQMSGTTHPLTALNPRRPDSAVALCFWTVLLRIHSC